MREGFTVAICTRNRASFLKECLDGLVQDLGETSARVLVIDNGSQDDTRQVVAAHEPRCSYHFEANIGLSHARNRALRECETEYLTFLDDDAVPNRGWSHAVRMICDGQLADVFGGPYTPFYLHPKPRWFDDSFGSAHLDLQDGYQPPNVCFSGGNMGWRTALLLEAGGFRTDLGMIGSKLGLGEETQLQLHMRTRWPSVRFLFSSGMSMRHYVSPEKMTFAYIARRNFHYGYHLREIDPDNLMNAISLAQFLGATKCGLPILFRAMFRNKCRYPFWGSFLAAYLNVHAISAGALVRRWHDGARPT